ncbi:MAG: dTMP kinase [Rhodospirillales bacterium]|nr:MAG: dTMP kinase [Rhodospirillales bacterium]
MAVSAVGRFITLEGGEGAGKSTQIRLLAEALRARGRDVETSREPGGSPGAEAIRKLLVEGPADAWDAATEALLMFAARRDHVERTILPALRRGVWLVCDRFADSSMAYQGHAQGWGPARIDALHTLVLGGFKPDLTIILDLPVEIGLARAAGRAGKEDRYERLGLAFHRKVRDAFKAIAAAEPARCALVDADRPVDDVHAAILGLVESRLGAA